MSPRERYIRIRARQLGLDPNAVVADSLGEGAAALRGGNSIGDHGTSFGPFQLHMGGALPASVAAKGAAYSNNWANSKAGIDYALSRINQVAHGETGKAALADIVARFERPADIPGQIAARSRFLGQTGGPAIGGSAMGPIPAGAGMVGSPESGLTNQALRSMTAAALLQQSMATAQGAPPDSSGLLALAIARRQADAAQQAYGPQPTTGPLVQARQPQISGSVPLIGDTAGENSRFIRTLQSAVAAVGGTKVRVTSGYRSPEHNRAVGGAPNSNHLTGHALDGEAFIPGRGWVPLGLALKNVAPKYGLRSGATFNWGGRPDVVHVDDGLNQR